MAINHPVRVIAFQECDQWVAQCLEHDVCAQAPDLDTLYARVEATLLAEDAALREAGKGGIDALPAAPDHFFRMWDKRSDFNRSGAADGVQYELALCA
jgi:hypothetical protein